MKSSISTVVNFLSESKQAAAVEPTSGEAWQGHSPYPILEPLCAVLDEIVAIFGDQQVQKNITDWPFEHFWGNPYETRHSKLLGYLIDPTKEHGCGLFLLRKFFEVLQADGKVPSSLPMPDEECRVAVESEYIDLLITRECADGKYAVIIENKVNGAGNQPQQLQRYVESVRRRNFSGGEIHVFYLPLNPHQHPDEADLSMVRSCGAHYEQITFETHILRWLNSVLDEGASPNWPDNMRRGMHENLSHYRNLIAYLIKQQKEMSIDEQILDRIKTADASGSKLDWAEVKNLKESSASLQKCLESTLRGELLLTVQKLLKEQGVPADFYASGGSAVPFLPLTSAYDKRFEHEKNLCVKVSDAAMVCFGGYAEESPDEIFFEGCMRCGDSAAQAQQEPIVLSEMRKWLPNPMSNLPWYAWGWNTKINYTNCRDSTTADLIAQRLLEMRDQLLAKGETSV